MAYYYGTVRGGGTPATRQGTRQSGLVATLATWGVGIRVTLEHDANSGEDVLTLERIPWTSAADADAPGRVLLRIPLGALALKAPEIVDVTPALDTKVGWQ